MKGTTVEGSYQTNSPMTDVTVYDHAVQNYIERVLGLEYGQEGEDVREFAKEQIIKSVQEPDNIYKKQEGNPPVNIHNGCASIVRTTDEGNKEVPTVYKAGTFLWKMDSLKAVT